MATEVRFCCGTFGDELGSIIGDKVVGLVVEVVGVGLVVCVRPGEGEGAWAFVFGSACGFGAARNGMNSTVPRVKSFLESCMVWLIADALVVPHQL